MEQINEEFNIPFYIFEEIVDYIELTSKGECKTAKWQNIKALLNVAKENNRFTQEQVEYIINTYCRE